ncbi:cation diffusion facilitator family transporter [Rhizosaccharibacter radicis]|uniref:Cation diffusion facilitator family transporter n=1 Tax=Rhizosaccharibacter radicis TaxID=2782605 RepID=A0ABT1VTE1_9PROT|nr:cation diffusion facilitator family transporter [Acetobacteraceae bacterium KSS12]
MDERHDAPPRAAGGSVPANDRTGGRHDPGAPRRDPLHREHPGGEAPHATPADREVPRLEPVEADDRRHGCAGHHDGHHDHDHHDHAHPHHDHDHGGGHGHHHGPGGHHHAPANFGTAFAVGISLNLLYVAGEAFYGVLADSLSLVADAAHNLGDVLGLVAAWLAAVLSRRRPSSRFTYGLRRSSILSALFNAVVLLVATGGIAVEAVRRLVSPGEPAGLTVMVVAAIGIAVNGGTALLFMSGARNDINLRGAFLHMAADAATAAAVVVAGALILFTGWTWIDPVASLLVGLVILLGTWSLLRQSLDLALDAVPPGIDRGAVERMLLALPGVAGLHHLHIWAVSTTETALTVHLVHPHGYPEDAMLRDASDQLRRRHNIAHSTFQVERAPACPPCALEGAA